jgi:pantothenate kinase
MEPVFWRRLHAAHLTLDGTDVPLEFEAREVERFYLPLAGLLVERAAERDRYMVAIAGPPGSGKSAFTALLSAVINAHAGAAISTAIGLDGWHYPNSYLDSHTVLREGNPLPLRHLKGSPPSFDSAAAFDCLSGIREGQVTTYPVYSRACHDPIPDGGVISLGQRILLVEGNYLLLAIPPWAKFRALFDLSIFLTAPHDALEDAIRQRHLRGGKDAHTVQRYLDLVDLPDIDLVLAQSSQADILVKKADSRRIVAIEGF